MQITARSLSGARSASHYAKFIIICTSSVFALLLFTSDPVGHLTETGHTPSAKTDPGPAAKKMFGATDRIAKHSIAHALIAPVDTNQLKKSDWFNAVKQDIEKRMYRIVAGKGAKTFMSINNAQYLKASYSADGFSLRSLPLNDKKQQVKNGWQLNIVVKGLYEDGKLVQRPVSALANVASDDGNVAYNYGNAYTVQ